MKRRVLLSSIVIATLMIVMSFSVLASISLPEEQPQKASIAAYVVHAPILIAANEDFAVQGWPGSGTVSDPYIIAGLDITASAANGIDIRNTNAYFVVKNCYIHSGESLHYGILLTKCKNGTLSKNNCSVYSCGIALDASSNNTISNNNFSNTGWGIRITYGSNNNSVSDNNCSNGTQHGICLYDSCNNNILANNTCSDAIGGIYLTNQTDHNIIRNNNCSDNDMGIYLSQCGNNILANNTCSDNTEEGIYLYDSCDNNTIRDNNCSLNGRQGIYLYDSCDNTVSDNTCNLNILYGIYLRFGNGGNTIIGNDLQSNGVGIILGFSNHTIITNNVCNYSYTSGIYVENSHFNNITGNTCTDNSENGIQLMALPGSNYCNNNTLSNNTCSDNYEVGIYVEDASYETISGNVCIGNNMEGIRIFYGNLSSLSGNTASYNGLNGIRLGACSGSIITDNLISHNLPHGLSILSSYSIDNRIWNNTFYHNNGTGDVYIPLNSQACDMGINNHWNSTSGYGNWWKDWTTPDADMNGIVDLPYNISGSAGAKDFYPRASPTCTIITPTNASTYFTNWGWIQLKGVAYDEIAVTSVTWSSSFGGYGTAYMLPQFGGPSVVWQSRGNVQLFAGENIITATAYDAAGNTAIDTLSVTYDKTGPAVIIGAPTTNPTYSIADKFIDLGGTAYDSCGIARVTWKNTATGGSGIADGTDNWGIPDIPLTNGMNLIYVNATDNAGNKGTDAIWVTSDLNGPAVTITSPTGGVAMTTGWHYICLMGTASDDTKVTSVIWVNSAGGSGVAYMTPQFGGASVTWQSRGNVHLLPGPNVITVTAYDAAGNSATDVLTVTYTGA